MQLWLAAGYSIWLATGDPRYLLSLSRLARERVLWFSNLAMVFQPSFSTLLPNQRPMSSTALWLFFCWSGSTTLTSPLFLILGFYKPEQSRFLSRRNLSTFGDPRFSINDEWPRQPTVDLAIDSDKSVNESWSNSLRQGTFLVVNMRTGFCDHFTQVKWIQCENDVCH